MPKAFSIRKLIGRDRGDSGGPQETSSSPHQNLTQDTSGNEPENDATLHEERRVNTYGLSLLNRITGQSAQKYDLDVITVHGLGGHAYKTWTHDNGKLWLRDFLPADLPSVRVFTYGYNSTFIFSQETGQFKDYARDLLENIRTVRKSPEEKTRPLCFVCHSMGGIVVKQAIIFAKHESDLYLDIASSVSGILFLATPHQGSPSATYASILSQIANTFVIGSQISRLKGAIRTDLLRGLKTKERQLLDIAQDFRVHTGNIQIVSFIEQKNMRGLNKRIVDDKSSFMGAEKERIVPMADCDHREICMHAERTGNYKKLLSAISDNIFLSRSEAQSSQSLQPAFTSLRINVPQHRVANFVARESLLAEIKDQVLNSSSSKPVVMIGMGGSGKTQLALEFCRQAEECLGFMAVIWIDASSPVSVKHAYGVIAKKILDPQTDGADPETAISSVQDALRKWERRWLVVFDNYDNPKAFQNQGIRHYLPNGRHGCILFTSRHQDSARLGHHISVTTMSEQESLDVLLQRPPIDEPEKSEGLKIAFTLGHLALALDQAGAYIRARNLNLKDFIPHYLKRKERVLQEIPDEWEYRKGTSLSVFTTWELSFDQIDGDDEKKEAKAHFLTLAAFLDTTNISERYFRVYFDTAKPEWINIFDSKGEWDSEKLGDVLAELRRLSLLQMPHEHTHELRFFLHPIVRDWIKLRKSSGVRRHYTVEAFMMLKAFLKHVDDPDGLPLAVKQETTLHLDTCVQNEKELSESSLQPDELGWLNDFGVFYGRQCRYDDADVILQRALRIHEEMHGLDHPGTLMTVGSLAEVYFLSDRCDEAEELLHRILITDERKLGFEHTDIFATVKNLMSFYAYEGNLEEAELLEKLSILTTLALVYAKKGRSIEAEKLLGIMTESEILNSMYLEPFHAAASGASVTANLNGRKTDEVEEHLRRELMEIEEKLGPKDPHTLSTLSVLAFSYLCSKHYEEAEQLFRRALLSLEETSAPKHPKTLSSIGVLGNFYYETENYDEAEKLYKQALLGKEEILGPTHSDTLSSTNDLGRLYLKTKKYDEAKELLERTLHGRHKTLGPKHPETIGSIGLLGDFCSQTEDYDEAEKLYKQALLGKEETLGLKHPNTLSSTSDLGRLYFKTKRYDEAKALLERTLHGRKETLGFKHAETMESVMDLAHVLIGMEDYEEAAELFQQGLLGMEEMLGPCDPVTLQLTEDMAVFFDALNRPEEAMLLRKRLAVLDKGKQRDTNR